MIDNLLRWIWDRTPPRVQMSVSEGLRVLLDDAANRADAAEDDPPGLITPSDRW